MVGKAQEKMNMTMTCGETGSIMVGYKNLSPAPAQRIKRNGGSTFGRTSASVAVPGAQPYNLPPEMCENNYSEQFQGRT